MNISNGEAEKSIRPLTVVELEASESVQPGEIVATLWDYADSGSAIRGDAVVTAIERSSPSEIDLRDMREAAIEGIISQARNRLDSSSTTVHREQGEYAQVVGHIGLKLEELAK